jgi:hypothetical protein
MESLNKTSSGSNKKWIVIGLIGLVVIGGVIAAVVATRPKKHDASNNQVAATQSVVFKVKGTKYAYQATESDFLGEVAFTGSFDAANVKTEKIEEYTGYIHVTVAIGAASMEELTNGIAAINANWNSSSLKNNYGVEAVYLSRDNLPITSGPTVAPTQAPTTPAATTEAPTNGPFSKRINCGGTFDYVDSNGLIWLADTDFVAGVAWKKLGATNNVIYDTERFFQNLGGDQEGYHIPVPHNGMYSVNLTFVELTQNMTGARTFQPLVEDINAAGGVLDIFAAAPGNGIPVFASAIVNVKDLMVDIKFIKIKQNPKITAIEVIAL